MPAQPTKDALFLSKPGGKTKLGEKIVDERVTIYSDPDQPRLARIALVGRWTRRRKKPIGLRKGWSKIWPTRGIGRRNKGVKATPFPNNLIMAGVRLSLEDMIKSTQRGILVTKLWYIRTVDPQTLLLTGLTRDGTFYIENGKIKYPGQKLPF